MSTGNIAFIIIRLMLLFGSFNYGKRGILDKTHTRLFTFNSFINLIEQSGFTIKKVKGIPAPFPLITGNNFFGKFLLKINLMLIYLSKKIFSYQIYTEIKPEVSIDLLYEKAKIKAENEFD